MSDTMLLGVLRMPFELAMSTPTARFQYYQRGVQAADEIEQLRAEIKRLTRERDEARAVITTLDIVGKAVDDERAQLRAEVERLREALRDIAARRLFGPDVRAHARAEGARGVGGQAMSRRKKTDGERIADRVLRGTYAKDGRMYAKELAVDIDRLVRKRQREAWKAGYNFREIGAEMWNKP